MGRLLRMMITAAAAAAVLCMAGCGNTSSITSLTDSDSAAETVEPVVTGNEEAESVVSGAVEASQQTADAIPEIAAQTIETPANSTGNAGTAVEAGSEDAGEEEDENETEEANGSDAGESDSQTGESEDADESDDPEFEDAGEEPEEIPSDDDEADEFAAAEQAEMIDVEETDEGGPHGEGNTAVLTVEEANVRSDPYVDDEDDNVIGVLTEGQEVVVLGNEDGWYKIEFEGGSGYVSAELFE